MIRKLLITLTVVLGTIGVGWAALAEAPQTPKTAYSVSTAAELQAALTELNKASTAITSTITLTANLDISGLKVMGGGGDTNPFQGMFFLGNKNVSLTIDGANFIISGTNTTQGTTGSNTGAVIEKYEAKTYVFYSHAAAKLTFKDLTVGGTNIIGFNLHSLSDVVFNGVTVTGNEEGGIHLNSSKVTEATNLKTSGNGKFAIKLSREGDKLPGIVLGEGCNLQEMDVPKIGFYDRKAFATGEKDTPTKAEFEAMVSGTIGSKWNRGWQMAMLHTDNNSKPVRVWTPATTLSINTAAELQAFCGDDFATLKNIQLAAGTYTLDKQLIVDKPITVIGAGKDQTIIKGHICITAKNSAAVKFDKLAIEGTGNIIEIGTEKTGKETPIVTLTDCKVKSTDASGIRLLSVGAQLELKNTDIDAYYYGIGVRNEKQKITVDGGIITGWAALMTSAGGLATGDGTLANTGTVIDIKNGATLRGRSISDEGYGVITLQQKFNGVTLHIDGSTVIATKEIIETSDKKLTTAIKQLRALDIRSYGNRVTVTNSTLSALHSENALNAAIVSLGCKSADFGVGTIGKLTPDDLSIPAQNTITINGTLTNKAGEKYVTTYRKANNQKFDGLTINGTSYSVEAGNVCRTYQRITGGVTVDDNGNPIATNNESLLKAITDAKDGDTVSLGSDITLANSDGQYGLAINKKITLDGNGHTITAAEDFVGYMITVGKDNSAPDGIQIKNLTLNNNKKAKGLNIYASKNVVLTNVTSKDGLGAGVVVNSSTVTANGLYTSGNAWGGVNVDKSSASEVTVLPVFTVNSGTFGEGKKVYSDYTGSTTDEQVAKFVVFTNGGWEGKKVQPESGSLYYEWSQKAAVPSIATVPTITVLEAGQTLALSMLKGGVAKVNETAVAGLFAWKNPAEVVKEGTHTYTAVFTPTDLVKYAPVDVSIEMKDVKTYFIVNTGKCANGKVTIGNANAANKYEKGSQLTLVATPDDNYAFDKWLGSAVATYTVVKEDVLTAQFAPIMHTVTITTTGSGTVTVNGTSNQTTVSVPQGSTLSVVAAPTTGHVLKSLTCSDGKAISNGAVEVDKPFTITAAFEAKPEDQFVVNTTATANGKLLLFDANGNAVAAGKAVVSGTTLSVMAVADQGYTAGAITNTNGDNITDGQCTITKAASFSATFTKQTYAVTFTNPTGGTLAVSSISTGNSVEYGTELTATVTPATDYKLLSLVVNGKEIPNGGTFIVTAATKVEATMRKLATLAIDETPQSFVYDGTEKAFVVKTTPAGIGGFTVTYTAGSTAANEKTTKNVVIKRDADDVYAAVNITINGGLVINAAEPNNVLEPTFTSEKALVTQGAEGTYAWEGSTPSGNTAAIVNVVYTPTNKNLSKVKFSVWNQKGTKPGIIAYNPVKTKSMLRENAKAGTLSITATGGSVTLFNGPTPVSGELLVGQVLTVRGIPDSGNSAHATWTGTDAVSTTAAAAAAAEKTITLTEGNKTVTAAFTAKQRPIAPTVSTTSATYNGSIFAGATPVAAPDGWNISFKQGTTTISEPTNAGVYAIVASRAEDAVYVGVENQSIGTFTIEQAETTAAVVSATGILKGQSLAQSIITGTANVDGVFEWVEPNKVMSTAGTINDQGVKFVPANANYKAPTTGLKANVTVTDIVGVTLRTLTLSVNTPEKGEAVKMTLNGTEVASGAIVTAGDKLVVTYKATAANYSASATINGVSHASGATYVIPETGATIAVVVSYSYTGGGGSVTPSPIAVSSVSLDQATLALPRLNTATLVATINPTDAANKSVTWTSSDEKVATVDANGKVTAVKVGKATITVTTEDGGKTATCEVTVSVATGVEEILANTRVYAQQGAICIDPALPVKVAVVNMLGAAIYNGQIAGSYRIATASGVYVVKLSDGKNEAFVKVYVR